MHPHLAGLLKSLVNELALPGGRVVGTVGHATAGRWINWQLAERRLASYVAHSFALPYSSDGISFCNFVAVIPGQDRTLSPVLVGAHYDSAIPHPCADDNAAAVSILLAMADTLTLSSRNRDIVIAIFDAEEPPYFQSDAMGSVRFCDEQADQRGFHAALILDLVGHDVRLPGVGLLTPPAVRRLLFVQGAESHPDLATIVGQWHPRGLGPIATLNSYMPDMSDHFAFRRAGVPFLFLSCGQWAHYHQPTDTPEKLSYAKMARITDGAVMLVEAMARRDLVGPVPSDDFTVDLEASTIRRELGAWLKLTARHPVQTRRDIDAFAARIANALVNLA